MEDKIKLTLKDIVGPDHFSDQLIDLVSYSYDASDHDHRPEAAVWPLNCEQVSKIMRLACDNLLPVIPRGAGTGLAGGAVPIRGGLVLDLCRMNKIVAIRIADRSVVVQPGVVYADLENVLAPYGFFSPLTLQAGKPALWEATWPPMRRHPGSEVRSHPRLCDGSGGGVARRSTHAHWHGLHEVFLRL